VLCAVQSPSGFTLCSALSCHPFSVIMSSPASPPSGRADLLPAVSMVSIPYHTTPPGVLRNRTEEYLLQSGVPASGLGRRHLDGRIVATGCISLSAFASSCLPPVFGGSAASFPHGPRTASVIECLMEPLGRRLTLEDLATPSPVPSPPRGGDGGGLPGTTVERAGCRTSRASGAVRVGGAAGRVAMPVQRVNTTGDAND
jgi:hypothetical protein